MSIIDSKPAWTKGALKRLGEALVGAQPKPDGCPHYDDVLLWRNDLAAEVALVLSLTPWRSCPPEAFDIAARPKTLDTLVERFGGSGRKPGSCGAKKPVCRRGLTDSGKASSPLGLPTSSF